MKGELKMTFADQILKFNEKLSNISLDLPFGYEIINPFNGGQKEKVK